MLKQPSFPTEYPLILQRVEHIDPILYGRTRNNINGAVTYISPYLTHGVISLPQVRDIVLKKYSKKESYAFIFELAWREFFQRVYMEEGDNIYTDLKSDQMAVSRFGIPKAFIETKTTINAIDSAYKNLYETGYMHNHARMWSAMLATNVGHYDWWDPSRHMFYYLLDGDKASNTLSWQWVAGTFSSKQYVASQEMINKFAAQKQTSTYLDTDTSLLTSLSPIEMDISSDFDLSTDFDLFKADKDLPTNIVSDVLLYSIWTLDVAWLPIETPLAKILFIDRQELTDFPISPTRIKFILGLAKNITDLKIILGTNTELTSWSDTFSKNHKIYRKDHPAIYSWPGIPGEPEYLFPEIQKVPRGFMSYWKKCESYL